MELPVKFISYLHTSKYLSISLKNATPRKEIVEFLENLELMDKNKTFFTMVIDRIRFKGLVKSINSRRTHIKLNIHTIPTKSLILRLFNKVGKDCILRVYSPRKGNNAGIQGSNFKERDLFSRVKYLLDRFHERTDIPHDEIIYRELRFAMKKNRRSLEELSTSELHFLEKRLKERLRRFSNGRKISHFRIQKEHKTGAGHS